MKKITTALCCIGLLTFQSACFWIEPQGEQNQGNVRSNSNRCQLTLKVTAFASLCTRMEVENTGANSVDGWLLEMKTEPGATLISYWGAQINLVNDLVYIQPPELQSILHPNQSTTFGFCLSENVSTPVLHAGACGDEERPEAQDDTRITIETQPPAAPVASPESAQPSQP